MVRKTIIAALVVATAGAVLLAFASWVFPFNGRYGSPYASTGGHYSWRHGAVWIDYCEFNRRAERRYDRKYWEFRYYEDESPWKRADSGIFIRRRGLGVPPWAVACLPLPLGAYPAIAFVRGPFRRYRRRIKGVCEACAYDLALVPRFGSTPER